ncbi:MAG: hypothetical protein ACK55I_12305, partial [bacterium]
TNEVIFNYSSKSFRDYCIKYDLDYILITEPKVNYIHPTWERLDLWINKDHWFDKYDSICYVDTDVFALPKADNIFSFSKDNKFCRVPYWKANKELDQDSIF